MTKTKPILLDVPLSFETERLLVRAPMPGEGPELNAASLETLDDLKPWMPWAQEAPSVEETEAYTRKAHADFLVRKDFALRLWLKDGQTLVGSSGLHPRGWAVPKFEIGYWCRKRFQRQGYITEAVRAIARFGFETFDAKRIEIRCAARNERSRRVAERAGFGFDAELVNDRRGPDGKLGNTLVFSMVPA
jgi:RimJ/RimL family protein N-acetyltransferase